MSYFWLQKFISALVTEKNAQNFKPGIWLPESYLSQAHTISVFKRVLLITFWLYNGIKARNILWKQNSVLNFDLVQAYGYVA